MMTHEQRLDRLERIAKLFVKAGLRARANMRRLDEKIGILIDAQIKGEDQMAELRQKFARTDEQFARTDEQIARTDERLAKSDERFAKSDERFAKFESRTDQTLKILMEIMREMRNGDSKA